MVGDKYFYNKYSISKYEIHIIIITFGNSISYGSIFQARCMGNNTYKGLRRGKRSDFTPIQRPVLKNDKNLHYKRYSFNNIPQILAEKIMNKLTIKDYFDSRIVDTAILKISPEGKYEPLVVWDRYIITFLPIKPFEDTTLIMYNIWTDKL